MHGKISGSTNSEPMPDHDAVVARCLAAAAPDASSETGLTAAGSILGFTHKDGAWTRLCPSCHGTMLLMDTDGDGIIAIGIGRKACSDLPRVQGWLRDMGFQSPERHNAALMAMMRENAGMGVSQHPEDRDDDKDIDPLKVHCALIVIHDDSYRTWIRVAAALHNTFGDDGYPLFSKWSAMSPKFNKDECAKKWRRGKFHNLTRVTIKTIFWLADQHDRRWRDFYRQQLLNKGETTS